MEPTGHYFFRVPNTKRDVRDEVIRNRRSTRIVERVDRTVAKKFDTEYHVISGPWKRLFHAVLKRIGFLKHSIRLTTFAASVYLVNTGHLLAGVILPLVVDGESHSSLAKRRTT
jgi:hypothetical protein